MIIACPSCNARYAVDAAKIGVSGRTVKCAKCGHAWAQPGVEPDADMAPPEEPSADEIRASLAAAQREADAQAAQAAGLAGPDDEEDAAADFDIDFRAGFRNDGPADLSRRTSLLGERRANLPAVRKTKSPWPTRLAWLLLCLVVGVVLGGTLAFRTEIVDTWPAAKQLYDTLGLTPTPPTIKFGVRNPKSDFLTVNGRKVLRVEGELLNQSEVTADAPNLRVKFFDASGALIMNWRFPAPERRMLPGETVKFSTDIANPPSTARRIDVGVDDHAAGTAVGGSAPAH